jgi:peptidoglycan biosynthesis protein MviN/MurJ (putative lipid II flippase)
LALITSFAAVLHAFVLMWLLRGKIGGIHGRRTLAAMGKMFAACGVMALVTIPIYFGLEYHSPLAALLRSPSAGEVRRIAATGLEILAIGCVGTAVYAAMAKLLKVEELEHAKAMFLRKFRRRTAPQPE